MSKISSYFVKEKVDKIINLVVDNAIKKIKSATRNIVFKLIKIWIGWLGISILLVVIFDGWFPGLVIVISFFVILVYSIFNFVFEIKRTSARIAMAVPYEITKAITTEISNAIPATENVQAINETANKIIATIKNPYELIYNSRKAAGLAKEIYETVFAILPK